MNDQFLDIEELKAQLSSIRNYEKSIESSLGPAKILDKFTTPKCYHLEFEENFNQLMDLFKNTSLMKEFKINVEYDQNLDITGVYLDKVKFMMAYKHLSLQNIFKEYFKLAEENKIEILYGPIKGYKNEDGTDYEDFIIDLK